MKKNWKFRVWGFFGFVYLVSALLWAPVLLSGQGMADPVNQLLLVAIAFVPSITGILFTYLFKDADGRRDFWRRAWHWPAAPRRTLIAALLIFPLLNLSAYVLSSLLAGRGITLDYARGLLSSAPLLVQFLLVELILGALSEELGWRGYVLDELQTRWSALASALVLGLVWAVWHTPTFLVPGLVQYEMGGILSLPYGSFVVTVIMASILQTWAYNSTGRSTLVAGFLMHFLTNVTLTLFNGNFGSFSVPGEYYFVSAALCMLAALLVTVLLGPRTLAHCPSAGVTSRVDIRPAQ